MNIIRKHLQAKVQYLMMKSNSKSNSTKYSETTLLPLDLKFSSLTIQLPY